MKKTFLIFLLIFVFGVLISCEAPKTKPKEISSTDLFSEAIGILNQQGGRLNKAIKNEEIKGYVKHGNMFCFSITSYDGAQPLKSEELRYNPKTKLFWMAHTDCTIKIKGKYKESEREISEKEAKDFITKWLKKVKVILDAEKVKDDKDETKVAEAVKQIEGFIKTYNLYNEDDDFVWARKIIYQEYIKEEVNSYPIYYGVVFTSKESLEKLGLQDPVLVFGNIESFRGGIRRTKIEWHYNLKTKTFTRIYARYNWDEMNFEWRIVDKRKPHFPEEILGEANSWIKFTSFLQKAKDTDVTQEEIEMVGEALGLL